MPTRTAADDIAVERRIDGFTACYRARQVNGIDALAAATMLPIGLLLFLDGIGGGGPITLLLGGVLLTAAVLLAAAALRSFAAVVRVHAEGPEGRVFEGLGRWGRERSFRWDEVCDVAEYETRWYEGGREFVHRHLWLDGPTRIALDHLSEGQLQTLRSLVALQTMQFGRTDGRPVDGPEDARPRSVRIDSDARGFRIEIARSAPVTAVFGALFLAGCTAALAELDHAVALPLAGPLAAAAWVLARRSFGATRIEADGYDGRIVDGVRGLPRLGTVRRFDWRDVRFVDERRSRRSFGGPDAPPDVVMLDGLRPPVEIPLPADARRFVKTELTRLLDGLAK